jgi:hypothetical protein
MADPKLGKTPAEREAAIRRGGDVLRKITETDPEDGAAITEFLDSSGLGDHPVFARALYHIGRMAGEKPAVLGSDASVSRGDPIAQKYMEKSGMNP